MSCDPPERSQSKRKPLGIFPLASNLGFVEAALSVEQSKVGWLWSTYLALSGGQVVGTRQIHQGLITKALREKSEKKTLFLHGFLGGIQ